MEKVAVWKAVAYEGLEYLDLYLDSDEIQVFSALIGVIDQSAIRLHYNLVCNGNYVVREVGLSFFDGDSIRLVTDGLGNWIDVKYGQQTPLPELSGCIDVDISATPFTNTLPI